MPCCIFPHWNGLYSTLAGWESKYFAPVLARKYNQINLVAEWNKSESCARVKYFGLCLLFFFFNFYWGHYSYRLHLGHIRVFLLFLSGDGFVPERTNSTNLGPCFPERWHCCCWLIPFSFLVCSPFPDSEGNVGVTIRQSQICIFLRCGRLHHASQGSDCRSHIVVKHGLKEQ